MTTSLAFFGAPGTTEMLVIGIIALLLFGKRLPEVARGLGKGLTEFKKGVAGVEDSVRSEVRAIEHDVASDEEPAPAATREEPLAAPRFSPPAPPQQEQVAATDAGDKSQA